METELKFSDLIADLTKYNIDENIKIGFGIFGDVVKATLLDSKENESSEFAIQRCHEIHNADDLKLFIKKIEIQSNLKHHAVLSIIGYSFPISTYNYYAIVLPFMRNGNLSDLINKIGEGLILDTFETKRSIISFGIAAGMAHIHQNNIIHRDLKPSNILLDENYYPKISDFNYGKFLLDDLNKDSDTINPSIGTPKYWAPELFKNSEITNKVDVYSYAIILYELWTTNPAFSEYKHLTSLQLRKLVISGKRPIIREGEIPHIIRELIQDCWNDDPNLRPTFIQIVRDFMDRKDKYFNDEFIDKVEVSEYISNAMRNLNFFEIVGQPVCYKCEKLAIEFCHKCFHPFCMFCFDDHKCDQLTNSIKKLC